LRDPTNDNPRAEDDWNNGVTNEDGSMISLVDYVQDKSGGTTVNVYTFAKLNYNSEFETFLPGLTVTQDSTCDWIMAQIMVMRVAED
jgi:hypothetical protein